MSDLFSKQICPRLIHLSVESTKVTPKGLALFLQCHPGG